MDDTIIYKRINYYINKNIELISLTNQTLNIINLMNYLCTQSDFIERNFKFKKVAFSKFNSLKSKLPSNIPQSLLNHFNQTLNKVNVILK